jgi:malate dehydrogenase (oxaloacetate-decarboxylating)(NADP+)
MNKLREEVLRYHKGDENSRPGKIGIVITKPCENKKQLSFAYTPGVAIPCLEIAKDKEKAYDYTNKENSVAVVSNGTAVLGLGNIGALAGKPVMEGKAVLFKKFGDVDATDILIDTQDTKKIIEVVKLISPTYGGINLEDIKAPECFEIEEKLKKELDIPVFHDDQHGTAIVSSAGLINASKIVDKKIEEMKVVFLGAGAAGIASAKLFLKLGVKKENLILCDHNGVIYKGRENLNKYKEKFAIETNLRTFEGAIENADVFVGVSAANLLTPKMLKSMNKNPIVFAMANPEPEINPEIAYATRKDIILATGRSDYTNQINNVLAFPFVFRGALDIHAREINDEMKIAAAKMLAEIARENGLKKEYIIPGIFEKKLPVKISFAVAEAGIKSGVARKKIDLKKYKKELEKKF